MLFTLPYPHSTPLRRYFTLYTSTVSKRKGFMLYMYVVVVVCLGNLLLWTGISTATDYYIATNGTDTPSSCSSGGTSQGTAWKSFSCAIPRLNAGDTLYVMDGEYTAANGNNGSTGNYSGELIDAVCGFNANSGSAGNYITIKALNKRKAFLHATFKSVATFESCSYWAIEDLHLESQNSIAGFDGTLIRVSNFDHVIVRGNLVANNNGWTNSMAISMENSHNFLVEENEVYSFTRHGIIIGGSYNGTVRRNYVNSRDKDVPRWPTSACTSIGGVGAYSVASASDLCCASFSGGTCTNGTFFCPGSCENAKGDEGISCYPCHDVIYENNIVENAASGYTVQGFDSPWNIKYYGNIALQAGWHGKGSAFSGGPRGDKPGGGTDVQMLRNLVLENNLIYDGASMSYINMVNATIQNNTIYNAADGIRHDRGSPNNNEGGDSGIQISATISNNVMYNLQYGYGFTDQADGASRIGLFARDAWVGGGLFYTMNNNIAYQTAGTDLQSCSGCSNTNYSTNDPGLGACRIFPPSGSTAAQQGAGATILYKYQDGVLTSNPLWNADGTFTGCGVIIAGVNDVSGSSCINVNTRLNVNTGGCSFPAGYAQGEGAVKLVFNSQPTTVGSGQGINTITVSAVDGNGVVDDSYTNNIAITIFKAPSSVTVSADSQETQVSEGTNYLASYANDGIYSTMWHTAFVSSSPAHPHYITIDMGSLFSVNGVRYMPRQDSHFNGVIKQYEVYGSTDCVSFGSAIASGTLVTTKRPQTIGFTSLSTRCIRLTGVTDVNSTPYTSAADVLVQLTSGGTLSGTSTLPAVAGVASFTGLSITPAGKYVLVVNSNGPNGALDNMDSVPFMVTSPPEPPPVVLYKHGIR